MTSEPVEKFQAPEISELEPLFPSYNFQSMIAVGGMGAVYRAEQVSLEREVAIKVLPRSFGEDETFRAQFEAEAKAMAKLNHTNLLGIMDFGSVDGMPFIVMEFVHGTSLHHAVNGMPVESLQSAEILLQVAKGIEHAHEAGMLHRDIKPANILLDQAFCAKVADFGLARQTSEDESQKVIWGTPGYTAPEVLHPPYAADERADIYSLGGVLYFMLTARTPDPNDVNLEKLVRCDPRFQSILTKCLHQDPEHRYKNVTSLIRDLEELIPMLQSTPGSRTASPAVSPLVLGANPMASVPTTSNMAGAPSSTAPMTTPMAAGMTTPMTTPMVSGATAPLSAPPTGYGVPAQAAAGGQGASPPPVVIKSGGGAGGFIAIGVVLAVVGVALWIVMSRTGDPEPSKGIKYSGEKSVGLKNFSFETFEGKPGDKAMKIASWEAKKKGGAQPEFGVVQGGEDGAHSVRLLRAELKQQVDAPTAPLMKYKVSVAIAKTDDKPTEVEKDYGVEVWVGGFRIFWLKENKELKAPDQGKPQFQELSFEYTLPEAARSKIFDKKPTLVIWSKGRPMLFDDVEFVKQVPEKKK